MYLNLLERKIINMSNNFNLMSEIMKLKNHHPEYAKQIEKALPILVDEEIIAAIDADGCLEEDDKSC